MTLNSSGEEVQQNTAENPQDGQSGTNEEVIKREDYVNLQSDYTKKSQYLIEVTLDRARENPKSILDIKDLKLQNKVVSEIYWLNSISELKTIYGEEFYIQKDEANMDDMEKLKREVAILRNSSKSSELESSIREFKNTNKELFTSWESEDKLREALQLLSNTISSEERVRLASKLVFGNVKDPTSAGFQMMQNANVSWGTGANGVSTKTKTDDKANDLRAFLGLK